MRWRSGPAQALGIALVRSAGPNPNKIRESINGVDNPTIRQHGHVEKTSDSYLTATHDTST